MKRPGDISVEDLPLVDRLEHVSIDDPLSDRRVLGATGAVLLLLGLVPVFTTDYWTNLVALGFVFVLLGVSWNLLAGYAGQISLGHAAFFGLGAFVAAWLTAPTRAGLPEVLNVPQLLQPYFVPGPVSVVVVVLLAGLVPAVLSLLIGPIIFRLRGHYFAVGTLALAVIIQLVMEDQRQFTGGATGYYVRTPISQDGIYILALIATVLSIVGIYRIVDSPLGLGMKAIHDDEEAASSLGVRPLTYKMYAFVISSFVAGVAGGLFAQGAGSIQYINPGSTLGVTWTIDTLVVVILGGMGTVLGPVLGAGLFLVIDNMLSGLPIVGDLATTVEGALIILFVIFLPHGLYGLIEERVLSPSESAAGTAEDDAPGPADPPAPDGE